MIRAAFERWNRRHVIRGFGAGTVTALFASCVSMPYQTRHFRHGVASGDPLQNRVIIWTRVSDIPERHTHDGDVPVQWEMASDPHFRTVAASGSARTGPDTDYTVKIDVSGLFAGSEYFYRFRYAGEQSPVGRTKTLPVGEVESISIAVVSCSNYPAGFFNVYNAIAKRDDIDAVVHLGDYIYEYGAMGYGTEQAVGLDRIPDPRHEILTLNDYRVRYAQYRSDSDLQALHRKFPMIAIWDDHESANNSWRDGAENHSIDEGDWRLRKAVAQQAFREWLPVRDSGNHDSIYRSFEFGDLASLIMLDTRMAGRDKIPEFAYDFEQLGVDSFRTEILQDPTRDLLGKAQSEWLANELRQSKAAGKPWQIIGQQVIVGNMNAPDLDGIVTAESFADTSPGLKTILEGIATLGQLELPVNLDSWDGYAAARKRLFSDFWHYAANVVVLSGDSHSAAAFDLTDDEHFGQVGVEFAVTSVTSSGFGSYLPETPREVITKRIRDRSPRMRYLNIHDNGFCVCSFSKRYARSEWFTIDTVSSRDYTVKSDRTAVVRTSCGPGSLPLEIDG